MEGQGDYGAWTSDDFDDYVEAERDRDNYLFEAENTYWAEYFAMKQDTVPQAFEVQNVELFARWEHELSLPDHYGNRAYTHWFVEVAL